MDESRAQIESATFLRRGTLNAAPALLEAAFRAADRFRRPRDDGEGKRSAVEFIVLASAATNAALTWCLVELNALQPGETEAPSRWLAFRSLTVSSIEDKSVAEVIPQLESLVALAKAIPEYGHRSHSREERIPLSFNSADHGVDVTPVLHDGGPEELLESLALGKALEAPLVYERPLIVFCGTVAQLTASSIARPVSEDLREICRRRRLERSELFDVEVSELEKIWKSYHGAPGAKGLPMLLAAFQGDHGRAVAFLIERSKNAADWKTYQHIALLMDMGGDAVSAAFFAAKACKMSEGDLRARLVWAKALLRLCRPREVGYLLALCRISARRCDARLRRIVQSEMMVLAISICLLCGDGKGLERWSRGMRFCVVQIDTALLIRGLRFAEMCGMRSAELQIAALLSPRALDLPKHSVFTLERIVQRERSLLLRVLRLRGLT